MKLQWRPAKLLKANPALISTALSCSNVGKIDSSGSQISKTQMPLQLAILLSIATRSFFIQPTCRLPRRNRPLSLGTEDFSVISRTHRQKMRTFHIKARSHQSHMPCRQPLGYPTTSIADKRRVGGSQDKQTSCNEMENTRTHPVSEQHYSPILGTQNLDKQNY